MAVKQVEIEGIGSVSLYKRRGASHVRLSLTSSGQVRVTMPIWAPYQMGIEFARTKAAWIQAQKRPARVLSDGQLVGKAHHIRLQTIRTPRIATRVINNTIHVGIPSTSSAQTEEAQRAIRNACIRALRAEAEKLLPQRLASLANHHGFTYRSVSIKQMKGRWGSCSHQKDIVLNCFLMQLPWDLIDYVILHELTHTRIMAHGRPFWDELSKYVHNLPDLRKRMREQQPVL